MTQLLFVVTGLIAGGFLIVVVLRLSLRPLLPGVFPAPDGGGHGGGDFSGSSGVGGSGSGCDSGGAGGACH